MIDVLVLSAGAGTRVDGDKPKALIDKDGKEALKYVTEPFMRDCFRWNLNIRKDEERYFKPYSDMFKLFTEETPIGNAGALKEFGKYLTDPFLVIHNDVYVKNLDMLDIFIKHCKHAIDKCMFTMVVKNIGKEKEDGAVVTQKEAIVGFTRQRIINCGIYCVSHSSFDYIDGDGAFQDIDDHLVPELVKLQRDYLFGFNKVIMAYKHTGYYESWGK